jgi:hypothetical protein
VTSSCGVHRYNRRANERGEEVGAEPWSDGSPDFPPTSLRSTLGRAGRGETGRDAEGLRRLSAGRLCTSRAMIGTRWGWDGTREVTAVRPVNRRHCLHRFESCPRHIAAELRKRGPRVARQARLWGRVSLRFRWPGRAGRRRPRVPSGWAEDLLDEPGDPWGGLGELVDVNAQGPGRAVRVRAAPAVLVPHQAGGPAEGGRSISSTVGRSFTQATTP